MLLNLHKQNWTEALKLKDFEEHKHANEDALQKMLKLATAYNKSVQEESTLSAQELKTRHVGKQDPKRHLEEAVEDAMASNIVQSLCVFPYVIPFRIAPIGSPVLTHANIQRNNASPSKQCSSFSSSAIMSGFCDISALFLHTDCHYIPIHTRQLPPAFWPLLEHRLYLGLG